MKSYREVLEQHYYQVLKEGNILHNDGNGAYLILADWPTHICPCPTMEHIESLR